MKLHSQLACAALLVLSGVSSAFAAGISVEFKNTSKWDIHSIYLSPVKEKSWGPDQLGAEAVIKSGANFTLTGIEPNKYDIKIDDEDGDECIIEGVKLGASESVNITDENLLGCQTATESDE